MAFLLVMTVLLPMAGSVALFALPGLPARSARLLGLGVALVTLGFSLVLVASFATNVVGPQFAFQGEDGKLGLGWISRYGIRFAFGLDGISLGMFALTSLLTVTAIFSSWESVTTRASSHYGLLLALQSGLLGMFASLDVILFYTFFEFTLIPLFFLIGVFGGPERRRASVTYFLYTLAGSLLTLLGVIGLVAIHYQYSPGHVLTFSIPELTAGLADLPWADWQQTLDWGNRPKAKPFWFSPQVVVFLLLAAGFAVKAALFPLHTWLPLTYVESPTAGSILLAGVMSKVGIYGFLRFNLAMTPFGAKALAPLMATLAVVSILYGALAALAQTDLKRLVAYSSISHMGFLVLGLFSLNLTGMDGSAIQMINHGLTTGALFACVGMISERYQAREISEVGGLWNRFPLWAFFFILASLGSAALPGLNGFVGEFPILVGAFGASPITAVFAALGMILGAYYLLWMLQNVVFGPLVEPSKYLGRGPDATAESGPIRPVGWHEVAGLAPLMVLIVWIGVYPAPFFDRIKPSLVPIAANFTRPRTIVVSVPEIVPLSTRPPGAQDVAPVGVVNPGVLVPQGR